MCTLLYTVYNSITINASKPIFSPYEVLHSSHFSSKLKTHFQSAFVLPSTTVLTHIAYLPNGVCTKLGRTKLINMVHDIWLKANHLHVASSDTTSERDSQGSTK